MQPSGAGETQVALVTARNTNKEETTYTFEYKDSGNISKIQPTRGFVRYGHSTSALFC